MQSQGEVVTVGLVYLHGIAIHGYWCRGVGLRVKVKLVSSGNEVQAAEETAAVESLHAQIVLRTDRPCQIQSGIDIDKRPYL